jgi:hypothetical protein
VHEDEDVHEYEDEYESGYSDRKTRHDGAGASDDGF